MKVQDRISEREYQDRLETLLKTTLTMNPRPLRSLETATKKRRAQKKAAASSGFTKLTSTNSGLKATATPDAVLRGPFRTLGAQRR